MIETHEMRVRVKFLEELLGTSSNDPNIHSEFIASKAPDAISREEEVAAVGVDEVVEKAKTVFPKDKDGNPRQLHTQEAAEAVDCEAKGDYRTAYRRERNQGVEIVRSDFFTTAVYDIDEPMALDYSELDSFVLLVGVGGECSLAFGDGTQTTLRAGETVLLPATTGVVVASGEGKFLETYIG